jgi:hypothetical protein
MTQIHQKRVPIHLCVCGLHYSPHDASLWTLRPASYASFASTASPSRTRTYPQHLPEPTLSTKQPRALRPHLRPRVPSDLVPRGAPLARRRAPRPHYRRARPAVRPLPPKVLPAVPHGGRRAPGAGARVDGARYGAAAGGEEPLERALFGPWNRTVSRLEAAPRWNRLEAMYI